MPKILEACIEYNDRRKVCTATENNKTYRLENKSGFDIKKVKVDKCIPQKVGEGRCDFLMSIEEKKRVIFIELKGTDLKHALEQILDTIRYLIDDFKGYQIDARIVGSGDVPNLKSQPQYAKLASVVLPTNGKIQRGTNKVYSENI